VRRSSTAGPGRYDKLALIASAIVVGAIAFALVLSTYQLAGSSTGRWMPIVGGGFTYTVTALYLYARTYPRRTRTVVRTLIAIAWLEIPVLVLVIAVYVGLITPPSFMWPYVLVSVFLAPIMVDGLQWFFALSRHEQ